jgi:hypothetical protein
MLAPLVLLVVDDFALSTEICDDADEYIWVKDVFSVVVICIFLTNTPPSV